ncbi:beta-ketoacyl synthase, N-terminal domain protein [Mycobacterium xenopi 4042]|uniref:Beta-ketoacyl synthase, N-terminal domain protein n=1 Tax=Mycobacterium xenopi 4042 TaxID=1299334 RepID=X8AMX4_MYCXE|nr:beta-ketoacyl synthase, N-terminal domain protein [Mycobacterium xenopi 4042]
MGTPGTAAAVGRPRHRPGRSGGHCRRCRARPYGSSRTRFEMEVDNELSAAGVLELAWTTGLIRWHDDPQPGWYDTESGELVDESELVERYHDTVVERIGIREWVDDGSIDPTTPRRFWSACFWTRTSRSWCPAKPRRGRSCSSTRPHADPAVPIPLIGRSPARPAPRSGPTQKQAVPNRRRPDPHRVRPTVWGFRGPGEFDRPAGGVEHRRDRRCVPVRGFSPAEVMRYVHPTLVATPRAPAWRRDVDADHVSRQPAGRNKPNDIFQEVLPNIIAAHVVQSYIGSYGAMIHPVGACATAAVSVEEGVDKIRLGKAELVVAGGWTT